MESRLATALRREQLERELALAPLLRLERARRLGDDVARAFARLAGVTVREAAAELARRRRAGRRPSRAAG